MFFIHGIHTPVLRLRQPGLHQVIQTVRLAAQKAGFEVVPRLVLSPSPQDVQTNLKEYEGRIDYSKPAGVDEALSESIHTLNLQEISNLEKHIKAWKFAAAAPPGSLHAIVEDDATMHPQSDVMTALKTAATTGGLTPLCTGKRALWLSKEAYFLTPSIAKSLLEDTSKIKFNTRGHLSWWASKNDDKVTYFNERVTIDGSKLGLFPSAIHTHNPLILNKEYTEMLELVNSANVKEVAAILPKFEISLGKTASPSPDYLHLLGILNQQVGNYAKARNFFINAIQELGKQGGVLSTSSDLLSNAFSIHKHLQSDLGEAMQQPSKYNKMSAVPL